MKLKNIAFAGGLAALVLAGSVGCKKSTFDINKNPNNPTDSTITFNFILPAAQATTATIIATDWSWLQNWMGFWARSGTYAPNTQEETYTVTTAFNNQVWNDLYANSFNYDIMQRKAEQADAKFYQGVARIMKAHNFGLLVDFYGNVPYTEAFKGNANPTPKYDKGVDIYKDLFRQLDTAITLVQGFNTAKDVDFRTNDLYFGTGRFASATAADQARRWAKFANTLKLRFLVHLMSGGANLGPNSVAEATVPGIDIAAEFAKINATTIGGTAVGFLQEGETVAMNPGYSASKPNPFYRSYVRNEGGTVTGNSVYYKANSYAIGYYNYNGDIRIDDFYTAPGGEHKGVAYGLPPVNENAAANLSSVGGVGVVSGATANAWIMTSVESLFLQAEARQRGFITSGAVAKVLYTRAVTESFVSFGHSAASADAYITGNGTSPDVNFDANPLYAILSQKWFALNTFAPYEVYSDWRRTNITYGVLSGYDPGPPISVAPQLAGQTNVKIPVRLLYPQTEYSYNTANVAAEGTLSPVNTRVFWDLN